MIIFVIIILVFVALFVYMFGGDIILSMPWNKQKAADAAQEYLAKTYQREMQHISTNYPPFNPFGRDYTVFFSPVDIPDLHFQVMVNRAFIVYEKQPVPDNPELYFSPDSYYLSYFEYYIEQPLQKFADDIWGTDVRVFASTVDGFGNYRTPYIFNEQMTAREMEPYLKYDIYISNSRTLDNSLKAEEAMKMLQLIEFIKENANTPEEVNFGYIINKEENDSKTSDSKSWIWFKNWAEITSVEEIENAMDERWFS